MATQGRTAQGTWRQWIPLVAAMAVGFALRTYHIGVPLVDTSDWRQTDTAAIAYFYTHLGIRLLHPQLWHDGPGPDYTQLELQLTPALTALAAHLVGWHTWLLHLVPDMLFTLSTIPLWALVRRHLGPGAAAWTALIYALLPVGIFFGRAFQPEPMMLLTGLAGLWAVDRWALRHTPGRFAVACTLLSVAVLAKLPNLMLLPGAAALAYQDVLWRWRTMLSRRWLAATFPLLAAPVAAGAGYTLLQRQLAAHGTHYVDFIVTSLGQSYIAGHRRLSVFVLRDVLALAITPTGLLLLLFGGALLAIRHPGRVRWFWVWGVAIGLYGVVVLRAIRFQYYLMPVLPWLAIPMGVALDALTGILPLQLPRPLRAAPSIAAVLLTVATLSGGLYGIRGYWPPAWSIYRLGRALNRTLPAHTTVILSGTYNPTLLFYARRHGYRVNPLTPALLQADIAGGARYLVDQGGIGTCLTRYIQTHMAERYIRGTPVFTLPVKPPRIPSNCS